MNDFQLNTPVVFIIFNRPDTTRQVFEEIRNARPSKLLIVADGPRSGKPGEAEKVAAARAIVEEVDWPCELLKNYSDTNLGCKQRISSGLDWVFQTVEEAIILEDDCQPHPTFFRFCEEMLEKYRDDNRVMHISGDNFQFGKKIGSASYYFSYYAHVWGWATWRRAWRYYDVEITPWTTSTTDQKDVLLNNFETSKEKRFWRRVWNGASTGKIDTWDFQWAHACLTQGALSIMPNNNLVSNIGFGTDSTHTSGVSDVANMPTSALNFPLKQPKQFVRNIDADEFTSRLFFQRRGLILHILRRIKYILIQIVKQSR